MFLKRFLVIFLLIGCLIIGWISCASSNRYKSKKFEDEIERRLDINENVEIDLSDIVDFEFDEAVIFKFPTSSKDIYNLTGVKYNKSLDLLNGIIFFKNKKVVYEWFFEKDYENVPIFFIYPYNEQSDEPVPHYLLLSKDRCIFRGDIGEYGGERNYSLYPILSR